jgi:hypothetical protein
LQNKLREAEAEAKSTRTKMAETIVKLKEEISAKDLKIISDLKMEVSELDAVAVDLKEVNGRLTKKNLKMDRRIVSMVKDLDDKVSIS